VNIRRAHAQDITAIRGVLISAFAGQAEANLVDALRVAGELALALVAEQHGGVCGYVAFPRLTILNDTNRFDAVGLAPLAVAPRAQRHGIGGMLTREGLRLLAARDEGLVFVLGDPVYYARFGFDPEAAVPFASTYAGSHFMALRLAENAPRGGMVRYPAAFDQLG
jgi:putative acetyltransferase